MAVTQGDIGHAIALLATAQGTPTNQAAALNNFVNFTGSQHVTGLSSGLSQKLLNDGNQQAANLVDTAAIEAGQLAAGYGLADFSRWFDLLNQASDSITAVSDLSPQQSAANAAPISQRQSRLEAQIEQLRNQIGDSQSILGAFVATSTAPIQLEFVAISKSIREAYLLPADREALLAVQRQLLNQTEQVVVKAGKEGKDVADAIDDLDKMRKNVGGDFFDCLVYGDSKLACFTSGKAKWVTLGVAAIAIVTLLWFLMPFFQTYLLLTKKSK